MADEDAEQQDSQNDDQQGTDHSPEAAQVGTSDGGGDSG
jgi:hypothetical protein